MEEGYLRHFNFIGIASLSSYYMFILSFDPIAYLLVNQLDTMAEQR